MADGEREVRYHARIRDLPSGGAAEASLLLASNEIVSE